MSVPLDIERRIMTAIHSILSESPRPCALTLRDAERLARLVEAKAVELGVAVTVAVVDACGNSILLHRMDNALPASWEVAASKAYTAAMFQMPTHELGHRAQPGQPLYGIEASHNGRVILFGGGVPCRIHGTVVGAVGVSGGAPDQDFFIASHALRTFLAETGIDPDGGIINDE